MPRLRCGLGCRMSVVARAPDGTIRLYCKGADNVMLPRLRKGTSVDLLDRAAENLRMYSVQVCSTACRPQLSAS